MSKPVKKQIKIKDLGLKQEELRFLSKMFGVNKFERASKEDYEEIKEKKASLLSKYAREDFLNLKGVGPKKLDIFEKKLNEKGIKLSKSYEAFDKKLLDMYYPEPFYAVLRNKSLTRIEIFNEMAKIISDVDKRRVQNSLSNIAVEARKDKEKFKRKIKNLEKTLDTYENYFEEVNKRLAKYKGKHNDQKSK